MNATEQEALKNLLFALFLESPKRKAILNQVKTEKQQKKPSVAAKKIRVYQLGDTRHG